MEELKISINGEERHVNQGTSLASLVQAAQLGDGCGIAVALNSVVVRRAEWATRQLADGDQVLLIQAAQGG